MPNPGINLNSGSGSSYERYPDTVPSNASTQTSSVGASTGMATNSSYYDILRAIQAENNAFNVAQTEYVNAFNAHEAQKQREWLERMSNTAHEREVADLKKSGLNPVLSALNGNGAAVGNASSATGQKAVADNTLGNGIISMLSAMINASSAASVASIYANASMYAADRGVENNIRSTTTSSENNIRSNETSASNTESTNQYRLMEGLLRAIITGAGYSVAKKSKH